MLLLLSMDVCGGCCCCSGVSVLVIMLVLVVDTPFEDQNTQIFASLGYTSWKYRVK